MLANATKPHQTYGKAGEESCEHSMGIVFKVKVHIFVYFPLVVAFKILKYDANYCLFGNIGCHYERILVRRTCLETYHSSSGVSSLWREGHQRGDHHVPKP